MPEERRPAEYHSADRLEREGKALAAVAAGRSIVGAARDYGIPQTTLHHRLEWIRGSHPAQREERIREAEETLLDVTLATADAAQRELLRRTVETPESIPATALVNIATNAQSNLALRRGWTQGAGGQPSMSALAEALSKIGGGSVTLTVAPAAATLIADAEPVKD